MLTRIDESGQLFNCDEPIDTAKQYRMHYNYLMSNDEDCVGVEALTDSYNGAVESITDGSMLDVSDELSLFKKQINIFSNYF
jgi:hypothetical protein